MWQHCSAHKHVNTGLQLWVMFTSSIRAWEECDLRDFDHYMIVGERQAGLSISLTTDLLGFSNTTTCRVSSVSSACLHHVIWVYTHRSLFDSVAILCHHCLVSLSMSPVTINLRSKSALLMFLADLRVCASAQPPRLWALPLTLRKCSMWSKVSPYPVLV